MKTPEELVRVAGTIKGTLEKLPKEDRPVSFTIETGLLFEEAREELGPVVEAFRGSDLRFRGPAVQHTLNGFPYFITIFL